MREIPFVGPSYALRSPNVDAQKSINLMPIVAESQFSKKKLYLQSTPGKSLFCTFPKVGGRGSHSVNNRAFEIFGNSLYEVFGDKTFIERGVLNTGTGTLSIANNGRQICIVDGPYGYIFDLATAVFSQITDPYFLGATTVNFIDGYFMFNQPGTGQVYISALYNGLTGDPTDIATAEGSPDNLVGIAILHQQAWLFGTESIEIYYDAGDAAFPFQRMPGAFIEYGCAAPYSIAKGANTLFWLGKDAYGAGVVWMANGYQPQRISTFAVEYAIQQYGDISDAVGYCYQEDGHYFFVLNFTNAGTTWVYDVNIDQWHERAAFANGIYNRDRAQNHIFCFGQHLVADYASGNLYVQSSNLFTDNGAVIRRLRRSPHLADAMEWIFYSKFQIDIESGVGSGTGSNADPQIMLRWSDDGGHKWSSEHWMSMGKVGQYRHRAIWRRMGRGRDRIFEATITAGVKVTMIGANAKFKAGNA